MKYKTQKKVEMLLTREEAIVLHDFLVRESENAEMYRDKSEQLTLWKIEAQLDKMLEEPFMPDYCELRDKAREIIKEKFLKEGK